MELLLDLLKCHGFSRQVFLALLRETPFARHGAETTLPCVDLLRIVDGDIETLVSVCADLRSPRALTFNGSTCVFSILTNIEWCASGPSLTYELSPMMASCIRHFNAGTG